MTPPYFEQVWRVLHWYRNDPLPCLPAINTICLKRFVLYNKTYWNYEVFYV